MLAWYRRRKFFARVHVILTKTSSSAGTDGGRGTKILLSLTMRYPCVFVESKMTLPVHKKIKSLLVYRLLYSLGLNKCQAKY